MAKYHINTDTGKPGVCHADPNNPRGRGCDFQKDGVIPEHYGSAEEAAIAYENQGKDKFGAVSTLRRKTKSEVAAAALEDSRKGIHVMFSYVQSLEGQGSFTNVIEKEDARNFPNTPRQEKQDVMKQIVKAYGIMENKGLIDSTFFFKIRDEIKAVERDFSDSQSTKTKGKRAEFFKRINDISQMMIESARMKTEERIARANFMEQQRIADEKQKVREERTNLDYVSSSYFTSPQGKLDVNSFLKTYANVSEPNKDSVGRHFSKRLISPVDDRVSFGGWSSTGDAFDVSVNGKTYTVKRDEDGNWNEPAEASVYTMHRNETVFTNEEADEKWKTITDSWKKMRENEKK